MQYMHCISPLLSSSDQLHWVFFFIICLLVHFQGCLGLRSFWSPWCGSIAFNSFFFYSSICRCLSPKFFISNFFGPPKSVGCPLGTFNPFVPELPMWTYVLLCTACEIISKNSMTTLSSNVCRGIFQIVQE